MKKFISLILAIFMAFALAGCSCSGSSSSASPEGSFWLKNSLVTTVSEGFYEKATYQVTLTVSNTDITATGVEGTYEYEFKTVTVENLVYYQLDTTFTLTGTYTYKNTTSYELNDSVFSSVIFSGVDQKLKPISSNKTIKCLSPIADENGDISFKNYHFGYTVDWTQNSAKDALVTYTDYTEDNNSGLEGTKTFDGFFSSDFCENELLMLYPRMFERNDDFSLSLKVLNLANQAKETINVSTQSFQTETQTIWGKALVDCLAFAKSGTYSGTPITAYYVSNEGKDLGNGEKANQSILKHAMVKMESGIAGVGTLTYTLKTFENNQD